MSFVGFQAFQGPRPLLPVCLAELVPGILWCFPGVPDHWSSSAEIASGRIQSLYLDVDLLLFRLFGLGEP
jgi:hypothetical protein